jgi:transcriptional regulator with PAS, ATPase and Fis domain
MRPEPYVFVVLEGARLDAGGLRIALGGVRSLQIGRGEARAVTPVSGEAQVLEIPDPRMSGTHARIVRDGAAIVVTDAGSTNGTRVNGAPIARHALCDGDVLELGNTIFMYREIEEESGVRAGSLDAGAGTAVQPGFTTLDPELARRLDRLARVAPSALSILLLGETGTGKEVLARGLHALSDRPGPFIAVNCGAIPQNLVESQLFGHVRGAFSGALRDEPGLVRAAQHGTLLLDEIGDLPASSQAALLRVLQEGEVLPVGSTRATAVDVRVVAATHMPLDDLVEHGAFRRDLYARLAGYTFALAPLRDRRVDLGVLIAALRAAGKLGPRRDLRIQGDAACALVRHTWPLNIRELEQCLHAAHLLAETDLITLEDLPPAVLEATDLAGAAPPSGSMLDDVAPDAAVPLAVGVDLRARIVALLAHHDGNLSAVARELRTSRSQLYRLMTRHGVSWRDPDAVG